LDRSQVTVASTVASTVTTVAADSLTGRDPSSGTRLGDFTLLRQLGRGAQGEVYEARQESLGRLVALKVLPPYLTFNPERVQRFKREAEAGGRLDHPNTVGVHSVGEHDGYHYIAQELVAGGRTLGDEITAGRAQPELPRDWFERMAHVFVQVAEAVHAAHEAGIIHRDLKPGNILLTPEGQPKVADFGLAMVLDDLHRSRSGEMIGTPFYMSPEQAAGGRAGLDRRTDVFSLGTTLYEALTLTRPFDGETRDQVVGRILTQDPRDPRKVRPSVPRELAIICMRALEKRRDRRYQSAAELGDELRRFLLHEPIRARPPGPVLRAGKWVRRHPLLSSVGSVTLVAAVAVTAAWRDADANSKRAIKADAEHRLAVETLLRELLRTDGASLDVAGPSPPPPETDVFRRIVQNGDTASRTVDQLPELKWQLQVFTGIHYRNMSLFDDADRLLTASLATAQSLVDEEDFAFRVAYSSLQLAKLRHWTGRWDEARDLATSARTAFIRLYGARSDKAALAGMELARLFIDSGRPDNAEAMIREVVSDWEGGDRNAPELLWARQFLGTFLLDAGRYQEAAEHLLEVQARAQGVYPEREWVGLGFRVAHLRDFRGRAAAATDPARAAVEDEQAEVLYRGGVARLREIDPLPREDVANALINFGSFLRERGRRDEARAVLEDALQTAKRATGPDSRSALGARNSLAVCLYELGEKAAAEALWREVLESDRRAPVHDSRPALSAIHSLTVLCKKDGRPAEALELARELVARTPPGDPNAAKRAQLFAGLEGAAPPDTEHPPEESR